MATTYGLAHATRVGMFIKGGRHLEALAKLKVTTFDKIGTLTEGIFMVVDVMFVEYETIYVHKWLSW